MLTVDNLKALWSPSLMLSFWALGLHMTADALALLARALDS